MASHKRIRPSKESLIDCSKLQVDDSEDVTSRVAQNETLNSRGLVHEPNAVIRKRADKSTDMVQ